MGDEVACEGFGQNALVEVAQQFQGLCGLGFEPVDLGKGGFDAADDFAGMGAASADTERSSFLIFPP